MGMMLPSCGVFSGNVSLAVRKVTGRYSSFILHENLRLFGPQLYCVPGEGWCVSLVTFPPWHSALQKSGHWFHFYTDVTLSANLAYSEVFSGKFYTTPLV